MEFDVSIVAIIFVFIEWKWVCCGLFWLDSLLQESKRYIVGLAVSVGCVLGMGCGMCVGLWGVYVDKVWRAQWKCVGCVMMMRAGMWVCDCDSS